MNNKIQNAKGQRLISLNYLRAIAVSMILYDHLGGMRNPDWIVKRCVDFVLTRPLDIIQDFGAFGVSLFFVIGGFLSTYRLNEIKPVTKNIKKIAKIYLTSLSSFILFAVLQFIVGHWQETWWSRFSAEDWIYSSTLIGYFNGRGEVINGTTWFLIPLFLFYVLSAFYSLFHKRFRGKTLWLQEAELIILFFVFHVTDFKAAGICVFVFIPVFGMILGEFLKNDSDQDILHTGLLLGINWVLLLIVVRRFNPGYYEQSRYFVSTLYAFFMLFAFFMLDKHFVSCKAVDAVCNISLSVYVLQMTFGSFIMTVFYNLHIPFTVSFIITVLIILCMSWIHWGGVEKRLLSFLK